MRSNPTVSGRSLWQQGFTIIEILLVLGIIGIITAIAIANYLNALNRARQKNTLGSIRNVALAWESRATDIARYNASGAPFVFPAIILTPTEMNSMLSPTYIVNIPRKDGWGNLFDFGSDAAVGVGDSQRYAIRSPGRDGFVDPAYPDQFTTSFDCDIIMSNGVFVVYPEGVSIED